MTEFGDYRFAMTYMRHHGLNMATSADLDDLVSQGESMEEHGEASICDYYELTDDGWVKVDVTEMQATERRLADERYEAMRRAQQEKRWRVTINGPDGATEWVSSHVTEADAMAAAADLPAALLPTVSSGLHRAG